MIYSTISISLSTVKVIIMITALPIDADLIISSE